MPGTTDADAAARPACSAGAPPPGDATDVPTRTLVLGMAHHDGTILAAELYPVAEACGQSAEQVRSCLRRLVGEGLFERRGEGRSATFRATEGGHAVLASIQRRHRLAYAQDLAGRGWDRTWHLVAFAVPEQRRAARDALRDLLRDLGGAPVQGGLYVSPHRWEDDVVASADRLGLAEHVTTATTDDLVVGGERDPRRLVDRLWPLQEVARRYQRFIEAYRDVPAALEAMRRRHERLADEEFLPGALRIAVRFGECFDLDPLLPPELLPRPWPGREARALLARSRRLGVLARAHRSGPAVFSVYDEIADALL